MSTTLDERAFAGIAPILDSAATPTYVSLVHKALTIRQTEERLLKLFAEGRVFGTVHTCVGQEWTGIAAAEALRPGDFLISNHRCHGHYLAWTDDVEGLIAEIMGRETGVCAGRGGSQHLCKAGFLSNGIQGGMMPVAAGMALSRKLRREGSIGAIFVGDGTLGEGVFYEALNIIAKWRLPLFILLENNMYAQSTAQHETLSGSITARAEAVGLAVRHGNTWDWQALLRQVQEAVDIVRGDQQPVFFQIDTYRLNAHSKGDDPRDPEEIATFTARDPLHKLLDSAAGGAWRDVLNTVDRRISEAVTVAEAAPFQSVSPTPMLTPSPVLWQAISFQEERVVHAIRRALGDALEQDERVVLIGEDIRSPYGGAFKATQGLSDRFPARVLNTPIAEAAIVGIGSGLALDGLRPVIEIMFGDFVLLAADQFINHAAKFRWMYNGQVSVPLIVRTPMGGRRGYGPTHSQSVEKHMLGVPDTQVLALHHRYSPELVYRTLFATIDRPTLVVENKVLYGLMTSCTPPEGFVLEATKDVFPTVRLRPVDGADVTILTYGGMLGEAELAMQRLFDEHEILCEVVVPLQLYPLNLAPIVESVARTRRLIVAEEGQGFMGFGSEVISQLAESGAIDGLRVKRIAAAAQPIPTSRPLEEAVLPSSASLVHAAVELLDA